MPALVHMMSMPPKLSTARCTSRSAASVLPTATTSATALAPLSVSSLTVCSATSASTSLMTTEQPASARARAYARPMPRPLPVTTAILPSRFIGSPHLSAVGGTFLQGRQRALSRRADRRRAARRRRSPATGPRRGCSQRPCADPRRSSRKRYAAVPRVSRPPSTPLKSGRHGVKLRPMKPSTHDWNAADPATLPKARWSSPLRTQSTLLSVSGSSVATGMTISASVSGLVCSDVGHLVERATRRGPSRR